MYTKIALSLGSNLGDRADNISRAVIQLQSQALLDLDAVSTYYDTAPSFFTNQPRFLNAALVGTTNIAPDMLLDKIKQIEGDLGRTATFVNGPRVIDIDIIFMGELIINTPTLVIPKHGLAEREFVLRPLAEIAPDWCHPVTGTTVRQMLNCLQN